MHVPTKPPGCHTTEATARLWLRDDIRHGSATPKDEARSCQAFPDRAALMLEQGTTCDTCARLPEALRPNEATDANLAKAIEVVSGLTKVAEARMNDMPTKIITSGHDEDIETAFKIVSDNQAMVEQPLYRFVGQSHTMTFPDIAQYRDAIRREMGFHLDESLFKGSVPTVTEETKP